MANLHIDGICRGWDFPVLDGISLQIKEGEFFVLVGPSGAGKTTLLRIVAGLDSPDAGRILFDGVDNTNVPPYNRGVAMTFESYALYPLLTVYDNIASPLRARKLGKAAIKAQVHKVADLLRISDLLDRLPGEISGGQKQRTALGRTLVATPKAFLLDEPLSHLDAKIRLDLREQFHTLEELRRTATLYVTHDYAEALSLGDRVGVLSGTHIQQIGTPSEIFRQPASLDVASQFGQPSINIIPVDIEADGDALVAKAGQFTMTIDPSHHAAIRAADGKLRLGLRPQNMQVSATGGLPARMTSFQSLGSYGVLGISCGDTELRLLTDPAMMIGEDDEIQLSINSATANWFCEDGTALAGLAGH